MTSLFFVSIALWGAFALSLHFVTPVHAEVIPDDVKADVPAVMQQEVPDGATAGVEASSPISAKAAVSAGDDGFIYDPSGKRDPFKPYRNIRATFDAAKDRAVQDKDLEPLERYDLEKLQVVAILWEVQSPRAILRTPEGSTHTIVKNTKVGKNFGRVVAIREGEIVIQEKIFNDGVPKYEIRTLGLK